MFDSCQLYFSFPLGSKLLLLLVFVVVGSNEASTGFIEDTPTLVNRECYLTNVKRKAI